MELDKLYNEYQRLINEKKKELEGKEKEEEQEKEQQKKKVDEGKIEGKEEKKEVKGEGTFDFQKYVYEEKMKVLARYPFLAEHLHLLEPIAQKRMLEDYQSGKLQGGYAEYIIEAWNFYRNSIENEAKKVQRIPLIKKEPEEEKFYTMDDYRDFFIKEYLPSIKREGNIIEHIRGETTEYYEGKWKGGGGMTKNLTEKE